jgi:hypothetical protein
VMLIHQTGAGSDHWTPSGLIHVTAYAAAPLSHH